MSDLISFVQPSTAAANSGTSDASVSQATLANNFDTFLTLLTAQIQNQDPLEPLDSNQFTDQLVQFSGVEQQIRTNESMETLIAATRSGAGATLSGYLGQTAEVATNGAGFSGDPVTFGYNLSSDAAEAKISVLDSNGAVVYSTTGTTAAGSNTFNWNGETNQGTTAAPGAYFLNVKATNANEDAVQAAYSVRATVTGVDLTADEPALTTTAGIYAYSDIRRFVVN